MTATQTVKKPGSLCDDEQHDLTVNQSLRSSKTMSSSSPSSPSSSSPIIAPTTADNVAACALHHYEYELPATKGKPQPHEWTVFAAFIARHKIKKTCRVLASATGTKCTAIRHPQEKATATATSTSGGGCIVHDSHAEVLARRGLLRVLWSEIVSYYQQQRNKTTKKKDLKKTKEDTQGSCSQRNNTNHQKRDDTAHTEDSSSSNSSNSSISDSGTTSSFLENLLVPVVSSPTTDIDTSTTTTTTTTTTTKSDSNVDNVKFRLDPNIELHLYISDSPCGDASIYEVSKVSKRPRRHDDDDDDVDKTNQHLDGGKQDDRSASSHSNPPQQERLLFTGAKVIVSKTTGVDAKDCGGNHQLLSLGNLNRRNYGCDGNAGGEGGDDDTDTKDDDGSTKTNKDHLQHHHHNSNVSIAREQHQVLGKLRTKAGRSNLPDHLRSNSMSCSDKLALWSVVGVQGAFLTGFLLDDEDDRPPIIPIRSIVVGRDARIIKNPDDGELETASTGTSGENNNGDNHTFNSQYLALERAIPTRVHGVLKTLHKKFETPETSRPFYYHVKKPPTVHISKHTFASGKSAMSVIEQLSTTTTTTTTGDGSGIYHKGKRKRDDGENRAGISKTKIVPCGISINWNEADDRPINSKRSSGSSSSSMEVLVGARGIQQGRKPKSPKDYADLASRLSRSRLVQDFVLKTLELSMQDENTDDSHLSSTRTYQSLKKQMSYSKWLDTKSNTLNHPKSPLAGWIRSPEEDNFAI